MPVDVVTSIEIDRPRADVAAFAGDPGNATAWYVNIRSVEWETEPPVRVGSRMAFVAQFLGRRLAYTYEVLELVPNVAPVRLVRSTPKFWRSRRLLVSTQSPPVSGQPVGTAFWW